MPEPRDSVRIAFKPDRQAHVLSDTEVALIGENERVALRGEAYALLAPLLDGTRTADEIVAAVSDSLAPEMAYFGLQRLERGGFTTPVPAEGLGEWPTWWLAQGDDAQARVENLRRARVLVGSIGLGGEIPSALAVKLRASATLVDETSEADLEVCLIDDYLRPELGERIGSALANGRSLLPVRPAGLELWVGPFCAPDSPFDWKAFMARLEINRPADITVLAKGQQFPIMPTIRTPETLDVGLSLAALVVTRCAAGDTPTAVDGAVWTIDTRSLDSRSHALPSSLSVIASACSDANEGARVVELSDNPKSYTADGGHRVCAPDETLSRLEPLVSPITGIIPDIERMQAEAGVHVFLATQTKVAQRPSPHENRLLGRPSGAAGKGQTEIQARVSCLAEAVERYSCGFFGDEPRRTARLDELGTLAIDPRDILLFSEHQYDQRQAINQAYGTGFNWVPERFDRDQEIEWTPVWSLSERRVRWVPCLLCYFTYETRLTNGLRQFARADSNGCASGNTLEEAILQGLFELFERDACALWWYNRLRRPAIDLASFRDPFFDAMVRHYEGEGRCLNVLDLRTDLGVTTAKAVSWRKDTGGRIYFGLGCHLEPRLAVSRALTEHNQMAANDSAEIAERGDHAFHELYARWLSDATIESEPYVVPLDGEGSHAGDMENVATEDIARDIRNCVGRLRDLGHETLVLDHTRPDIGFPAVRVIVPGLRHFWARLAPGRLYDVPVSLGWIDEPRREQDLNPIPFFL